MCKTTDSSRNTQGSANEERVIGEDGDMEMDMKWDVGKETWEKLVDIDIKEKGYTGSRAIAVRNVQNDIIGEKEMRKRLWKNMGGKKDGNAKGRGNGGKEIAKIKRRIVEEVVTRMMASRFTNLETAAEKAERLEAYREGEEEQRTHKEKG